MKLFSATSLLVFAMAASQAAAQCPEGSMLLDLKFHAELGFNSHENTWTLTNICDEPTGEVIASGGPYAKGSFPFIDESYCLNPYNQYTFTIRDTNGDGLADDYISYYFYLDLGYDLIWDGTTLVDDSQYFGASESTTFGDPVCEGTSMMVPMGTSGGGGDPHFKTLTGKYFDFHGACDLVMMDVPSFGSGQGLELHVRTKSRYEYSFIESAALRIGEDILEVSSWGEHFFNGVEGMEAFPVTMGHFATVTHEQPNKKNHKFEIQLDAESKIVLSTFKDLVSVTFDVKTLDNFKDSTGLIGSTFGAMLARDGKTDLQFKPNEFGKEWQVRANESKLFHVVDSFPQYPEACVMPVVKSAEASRRLGEASISEEDAKMACATAKRTDMEACVYDVMATGELEIAEAGAF